MPAPFDQALVRRAATVWRRQGGLSLCDVCGARTECQLRTALDNLGETRKAKIVVAECGTYVPVIGFQNRTGLENRFNTFRRGQGWARRTVVGGRVGLFDLSAGEMIGFARVEAAHVGVLGDLLASKSATNHLMKMVEPAAAPDELQKVLRRAYGTTYAAPTETFCVIELRRSD